MEYPCSLYYFYASYSYIIFISVGVSQSSFLIDVLVWIMIVYAEANEAACFCMEKG